ncbi:F-box/kelch-repeat protein At3g23880-like [Salvia miltiorrhiza]|uniref:F-box/kelch-repeat protein At3g23880-like n=1 Tax=Salvia miltiorrhiza TaxID=226208 RepID=UPI0025ABC80E|nr:F-box/kelch-repeat protein At3g23880-like [Salvia miltiorrhiza]
MCSALFSCGTHPLESPKKLPEISNANFFDNFGFGWVESIDEYKVFVSLDDYNSNVGKVYSSNTKSWKTIELCNDFVLCWQGGAFASGKLYWKNAHDEKVIIFLDLKNEVFGRIELPFDPEVYGEIGVLGGFLCVLCFNDERGFRVWVMKESWEKVVTLSHLLELLQPPLVKGLNGDILVNYGSTVVVYDCQDNVFRNLEYCSCCEDTGFSSYEDCVDFLS